MIMQQNGGALFGVIPILPPVYRGICHAKTAKPEESFEFSMHTEGKEERAFGAVLSGQQTT